MFKKMYGIDLGTSSVKIYSSSKNTTYIEKNMIAVKNGKQVLAVGNDAYEMYEKAPSHIEVNSPMSSGTIADMERMEAVLYTMLRRIDHSIRFGSVLYFSTPVDLTETEKRAYYILSNGAFLKNNKVYSIDRPIADAIAMNLPIKKAKGTLIVNIGAQSTEMSVIAHGKVIISKVIPIGGRQMNESICNELRKKYNLNIGTRTARRLKTAMGALNSNKNEARKIVGIDSLSGLPREGVISSAVVNTAIEQPVRDISLEIKTFLERTPPQIFYQISQQGIYLTGGSTRLPNIDKKIAEITGMSVRLSNLYESCTIFGIEKIIEDKKLHHWASPVKQRTLKDK